MKEPDCRKCKDSYQTENKYYSEGSYSCISQTSRHYGKIVFFMGSLIGSCRDFKEKE